MAEEDLNVNIKNQDVLSSKQKGEIGLQAAMQMIPYVGGALATLYFGTKQERRFNRLISFYEEVANELRAMKEPVVSIDKHNQEALEAIIETLNEKVEIEHLEEKRRLLKNYLKNTLLHPITEDYDERKFFLETLGVMTLLELEILGRLYSHTGDLKFQDLQPQKIDYYALRGAIGRLESYGFVLIVLPGGPGAPVIQGKQDDPLQQSFRLTGFGRKFGEFCLHA